jgi:hypothetical protein
MADPIKKIELLETLAEKAANDLLGEARRLIPVGARVSYEMQRSGRKFRIYGEVTGHGVHRSLATFMVRNESTGKSREVTISAWGMRLEDDND